MRVLRECAGGIKSLVAGWQVGADRKQFFFEKKNQKTFDYGGRLPCVRGVTYQASFQ
jgi:hypothetical protein